MHYAYAATSSCKLLCCIMLPCARLENLESETRQHLIYLILEKTDPKITKTIRLSRRKLNPLSHMFGPFCVNFISHLERSPSIIGPSRPQKILTLVHRLRLGVSHAHEHHKLPGQMLHICCTNLCISVPRL